MISKYNQQAGEICECSVKKAKTRREEDLFVAEGLRPVFGNSQRPYSHPVSVRELQQNEGRTKHSGKV